MNENPEDLDIERLLDGRWRVPDPPPGLRESLLLRTGRLVEARARGRRRARLALGAAAAALLFGAGFASARLLVEPRGAPPALVSSPVQAPAAVPAAAESPEEIRRRVPLAPAGERRDLLRRAGDAFMARGDMDGALECYRQVMEIDGANPQTSAGRDDAWILAALRRSREFENRRGS